MAALPYIQLYVSDYLADTAHLTAAQHGAYLLLIFNYWQRGKPLNNSNERLTNVARMTNEEWAEAKPILSEFFEIVGDEWVHARIERDLESVNSKSGKASQAGKASAARRAEKKATNVEQTLNHTDTDTDTEQSKPISIEIGSPSPSADGLEVGKGKLPNCPHQKILELYETNLPILPQPVAWEGQRQQNLAARWRWVLTAKKRDGARYATDTESALSFFCRFFAYVAQSDFLTGRDGKWQGCDIGWLLKAENFAKVLSGNYENREAA